MNRAEIRLHDKKCHHSKSEHERPPHLIAMRQGEVGDGPGDADKMMDEHNIGLPGSLANTQQRHSVEAAHPAGHHAGHHISHSVALIAEVNDPATAQHIVEEEEKWVKSETVTASTDASSIGPPSEKIDYNAEANETTETELQRVQSKTSLAVMMADFPDGGRWAWFSLIGATLIAFSTFGIASLDTRLIQA